MARKKEYKIEIANPATKEKMNYIASQYPDKSPQELLDMAVDCLFKREAESIQKNIARLMGENSI